MAHLHRLIFAALVLLSAWVPSTSYASFPATSSPPDFSALNQYSSACAAAYGASCAVLVTRAESGVYLYCGAARIGPGWCGEMHEASAAQGNNVYSASWSTAGQLTCPANSLLTGQSCTCNSGFDEVGSSCSNASQSAKCSAAGGGIDLFDGFSSLPLVGASFCPSNGDASGCASSVVGGYCAVKAGVKKCTYEVKYGGGICTPPAPSPTESPVPAPCKGTYGQVNGVDVCLPLGSDPSVTIETGKKTETTTTPSGGGGPTTVTEDGTSSCIGSQCTTTTTKTTTGPDGVPVTSTETKSESKDDFCKNNPRSPQCISSAFGGSCAAAFTCDGDAVMCAITREQHIRNCKLFDDNTSSEAQLYGSEKNKAGSQTGALPGSGSIAISSSSFDTSDAIGGGSGCISDKSVTVAGSVVTIPFSAVCGHLAMLGNILLAVSFLLAGRIVVRG